MGPALAVSTGVTKVEPATPLLLIAQRETNKGVERVPPFVLGQCDIAQHIGLVIDFTVSAKRAATVAVHCDREVLAATLYTLTTGLAAGVMNVSSQGFMGAHSELRRAETVFCHGAIKRLRCKAIDGLRIQQ